VAILDGNHQLATRQVRDRRFQFQFPAVVGQRLELACQVLAEFAFPNADPAGKPVVSRGVLNPDS
jgi:hypothetical protein